MNPGNIISEFGVEVCVGELRQPDASSPPTLALWVLRAFARLAPADGREEWNARWSSRLWNLWILIDRGELAARGSTETAVLCRDAIRSAFWMRFNRAAVYRWLRGPIALLAGGCAALGVLAVVSGGFDGVRELLETIHQWRVGPRSFRYDPRGDFIAVHVAPLAFALLLGAVLVLLCGRALRQSGWKYWLFLASKLALTTVLTPLVWIECLAMLRTHMSPSGPRMFLGLVFTLLFLWAYAWSVVWVFTDQRRRCPVCLGRLALPVTFGSWASVLEPVTTEMVCDEGHGSLSMAECELSGEDRWTKLDASWKDV